MPKAEKRQDDRQAIRGTWVVERAEQGGRVFSPVPATVKLVVDDGKMTWLGIGKDSDENPLTYKLDPAKRPAAIDVTYPDLGGPGRGVGPFYDPALVGKLAGIYRLRGDRLEICYDKGRRPAEFATQAGRKAVLIVLKREPPPLPKDKTQAHWVGEKDGTRVELTIKGATGHWKVDQKVQGVAARIEADLRCVSDDKTGRLDLLFVNNRKEALVIGTVQRDKGGVLRLRVFPALDYRPVEGLQLHRAKD